MKLEQNILFKNPPPPGRRSSAPTLPFLNDLSEVETITKVRSTEPILGHKWSGDADVVGYQEFRERIKTEPIYNRAPTFLRLEFLSGQLHPSIWGVTESKVYLRASRAGHSLSDELKLRWIWERLDATYGHHQRDFQSSWEALCLEEGESFDNFLSRLYSIGRRYAEARGAFLTDYEIAHRLHKAMPDKLRELLDTHVDISDDLEQMEAYCRRWCKRWHNCKQVFHAKVAVAVESAKPITNHAPPTGGTSPGTGMGIPLGLSPEKVDSRNGPILSSRCQRCVCDGDHVAKHCPAPSPTDSANRCNWCGFYHPKRTRCPGSNPRHKRCDRCGTPGHLARACLRAHPRPPQEPSSSEPQSTTEQSGLVPEERPVPTLIEQNSAIILETPASPTLHSKLRFLYYVTTGPNRAPDGQPRRRGMIDSGATAFFASSHWWETEKLDPHFETKNCQCVASLAANPADSDNNGSPISQYTVRDVHLDDGTVLRNCVIYHLPGGCHDLIIPKSALSSGGSDVVWLSTSSGRDILLIGKAASHALSCLDEAGLTKHCVVHDPTYKELHSSGEDAQHVEHVESANYIGVNIDLRGRDQHNQSCPGPTPDWSYSIVDSTLLKDILDDSVGDKTVVRTTDTKDGERPEATFLYFELGPPSRDAPLGRLQVRAPWKEQGYVPGAVETKRAFAQARRAHHSLSPVHQREVAKKVDELITCGYISKARVIGEDSSTPQDLPVIEAAMPMFGVWNKGKGKVRLVVDGSYFRKFTSKASPPYDDTHMTLFYNLLSLRSAAFFVVGDFAQAYHSIGLHCGDAKKFGAICVEQAYIWHRVGFGLNFSGAGLSQGVEAIKHLHLAYSGDKGADAVPQPWRHMWTQFCINWERALADGRLDRAMATIQAAKALHNLKLYVDDYHSCDDDPKKCLSDHHTSATLAQAHGIASHESKVFTNIPAATQQEYDPSCEIPTPDHAPFLGLKWSKELDSLSPVLKTTPGSVLQVVNNPHSTKADLVSATSSFYDPTGLATEVAVAARRLCRSLNLVNWDATLPDSARAALRLWLSQITDNDISQRRALDLSEVNAFSDSSGDVKACDIRDRCGHRITSRAKLFTCDEILRWGTPRRETEAFVLACEHLDKTLISLTRMGIYPEVKKIYTDSQALLYRLRRETTRDMTPHERRLVGRCKNLLHKWNVTAHHIKSSSNPADAPSRAYVNSKSALTTAMPAEEVVKGMRSSTSTELGLYFDPKAPTDEREDLAALQPYYQQLNFITLSGLDASDILKSVDDSPIPSDSVDDYVDPEEVRKSQQTCPRTKLLIARVEAEPNHPDLRQLLIRDGILYSTLGDTLCTNGKPKYYLPYMATYLQEAIWRVHDKIGHKRSEKVKAVLSRWLYSPSLGTCISKVIKKCDFCLQYKGLRSFNTSSGTVRPAGLKFLPWQVCAVDIQGPMNIRYGSHETDKFAVVTITNSITGYCRSSVVWEFSSAVIMHKLALLFLGSDFPKVCFTDKGSNLSSKFAKRKFQEWNVVHLLLPSHPEFYSGFFEIVHRSINDGLKALLDHQRVDSRDDVEVAVLEAVRQFNVTPLSPTFPVSPHECMYIMSPRIHSMARVDENIKEEYESAVELWPGLAALSDSSFDKLKSYIDEQTARKLESLAQFTLEWRRRHSRTESYLQKKWRRLRQTILPGSLVYRYNPNRMKLGPKWVGPFKVVRALSHHVLLLESAQGGRVPELLHNLKVVDTPTETAIDPAATSEDLIQLDKVDEPPVCILDEGRASSPRRSARLQARNRALKDDNVDV